jgi:hypothetical protein
MALLTQRPDLIHLFVNISTTIMAATVVQMAVMADHIPGGGV